jgi:hypothetical protein
MRGEDERSQDLKAIAKKAATLIWRFGARPTAVAVSATLL